MFPKTHEMEQITGQPYPSTNRASRPKTLMREPSARRVYETEVESEQEQDTVEEEDVLEVELPVEEDELVDDTAQGDREVRSAAEAAFFAWLACQAQTGGYQDGKGLTENLVESEYQFWSQGSRCCPTPVSAILTLTRRRATITENPTVLVKPATFRVEKEERWTWLDLRVGEGRAKRCGSDFNHAFTCITAVPMVKNDARAASSRRRKQCSATCGNWPPLQSHPRGAGRCEDKRAQPGPDVEELRMSYFPCQHVKSRFRGRWTNMWCAAHAQYVCHPDTHTCTEVDSMSCITPPLWQREEKTPLVTDDEAVTSEKSTVVCA